MAVGRHRHPRRTGIATQTLEVGADVGRRLVAKVPVLFERLGDNPVDVRRHGRVEAARGRWVAVEDAVEDHRRRVAGEALPARCHFVQDDTERKEIGARIQGFAAGLFGRHVGHGADRGAHDGRVEARAGIVGGASRPDLRGELGQPEVQDLHLTAFRDEDVCRLDVPVENPFGMRRIQGIGHLDTDIQQVGQRQPIVAQPLVQGFAVQELHGEVTPAILFVEAVNRADVWMIQRRGGPGLTPEPLERIFAGRRVRGEHLQGHLPSQGEVLGPVHHTHAAGAQLVQDAIVTDGLADERGGHGSDRSWYARPALTGKGCAPNHKRN